MTLDHLQLIIDLKLNFCLDEQVVSKNKEM